MTIDIIPLVILIIYAITTIGIANVLIRKKLGSEHFLVAGRSLPLFLVVVCFLGECVGGPTTIGVSQRGFTEGIVAILYPISLGIAIFFLGLTMSARFRRLKAITVPEVVGQLFDRRTRLTSAIVIGVAYFFVGIAQIMAGGALLSPLLGIEIWISKLITALIFAVIIIARGLRSIALVNIIQVFFIYSGMLVALFSSLHLVGGSIAGGFSKIWNELLACR